MKSVFLYGKLGEKFGRKFDLNVDSALEAFRAIDSNCEGFFDYIIDQQLREVHYAIVCRHPSSIKNERDLIDNSIGDSNFNLIVNSKEIHVLPVVAGSGVITAVVAAWKAAAVMTKVMIVMTAVQIAIAIITKPPEPKDDRKDPVSTKSFLLSGSSNRRAQGIAVPLGYGRLIIGSTEISHYQETFKYTNSKNGHLESYVKLRYVDLISEGPILGLTNSNGALLSTSDLREGIFLNNVQVKNTPKSSGEGDNSLNYILNEDTEDVPVIKLGEDGETKLLSPDVRYLIDYQNVMFGSSPYGPSTSPGSADFWGTTKRAMKQGAKAFAHSVSNSSVSSVIAAFKFQGSQTNKQSGEVSGWNVRFAIEVVIDNEKYNLVDLKKDPTSGFDFSGNTLSNGSGSFYWLEKTGENDGMFVINGLATSAYQVDLKIDLGENVSSLNFIKLSSELDPSVSGGTVGGMRRERALSVAHIVEVINEKLLYPNSSLISFCIDSKNFSKVPARTFHVKLKRVLVPSNFDEFSKKYIGPWNGLFKGQKSSSESIYSISDKDKVWTDNPAWVYFDMLNNCRYGLGKYGLEEKNIDKWQLYRIAKYCDELVETDFPIENKHGVPRLFSTYNEIVFDGNEYDLGVFDLDISGSSFDQDRENVTLTDDEWIDEFGDGDSFRGKKIAFFIHQHSFSLGGLTLSQRRLAQERSAFREGEIVIEERVIHSSDWKKRKLTVTGPSFESNSATFEHNMPGVGIIKNTIGACVVQKNHAVVEPRFSSNFYFTERADSLKILNSIASVFRGITSYQDGKVTSVIDCFKKPSMLFNNSNVSPDGFTYSGVYKNKRITAVLIRYNNSEKNFKPDIVFEEDAEASQSSGYLEHEIMSMGVTSQSQARRFARWVLMTSQLETEGVSFECGQEAAYLAPGSIIEVSDEMRAGKNKSGRVLSLKRKKRTTAAGKEIIKHLIFVDKRIESEPSLSRIEVTIASGAINTDLDLIEKRSKSESSQQDQDQEIDSLQTPQYFKFSAFINVSSDPEDFGPDGQSTYLTDLMLKLQVEFDITLNQVKLFNHNLKSGDRVRFSSSGVLPGGLSVDRKFQKAYFVKDVNRHSFTLSLEDGGAVVNIVDQGFDSLSNRGGKHFVSPENIEGISPLTLSAIEQIDPGSAYSIAGLFDSERRSVDLGVDGIGFTDAELNKLGVTHDSGFGWAQSSRFGRIYIHSRSWILLSSHYARWISIDNFFDNELFSGWVWSLELGWIWLSDVYYNDGVEFWLVSDGERGSEDGTWISPIISEKGKIYCIFLFDNMQSGGVLEVSDDYRIGDIDLEVISVPVQGAEYYVLAFRDDFAKGWDDSYRDSISNSSTTPTAASVENFLDNSNFKRVGVLEFIPSGSESSIQGEESVHVKILNSHDADLSQNFTVNFDSVEDNISGGFSPKHYCSILAHY